MNVGLCKYIAFMCSLPVCVSLCGCIGEIGRLLGSVFGVVLVTMARDLD